MQPGQHGACGPPAHRCISKEFTCKMASVTIINKQGVTESQTRDYLPTWVQGGLPGRGNNYFESQRRKQTLKINSQGEVVGNPDKGNNTPHAGP